MQAQESESESKDTADLIALKVWGRVLGVKPTTIWRWRKRGWIQTVNISGRQYISRQSRAAFEARAASGEFAKEHKFPAREVAA
jgi:hypothetical protein